jgi:hypothetical protein
VVAAPGAAGDPAPGQAEGQYSVDAAVQHRFNSGLIAKQELCGQRRGHTNRDVESRAD